MKCKVKCLSCGKGWWVKLGSDPLKGETVAGYMFSEAHNSCRKGGKSRDLMVLTPSEYISQEEKDGIDRERAMENLDFSLI